ncbi:hypothetical protein MTBBW1_10056 [Desulfamplus magnetovallimortis]|uniref:Uncharacterized protein n=1 Tax=Desulfamplus magnetovallimortis TaxID=1246637 RepID=A0A1W1H4L1_9BACT|nr:hypothetical protein [Desulfamplus magnetovallimortis]SLM27397.1 hypothetical protein MTBBW1_10056 [Desulfamplus magnetovallimortis]
MDLDNFTLTGIGFWVASLFVIVFQGIASAMGKGEEMTHLLLCDLGYDFFESLSEKLAGSFLEGPFDYIAFDLSLFIIFMILGTIFLILGMLIKD